ncbi:hypothetical protein FKW77_001752 [Venturia effusa]|uniref:Uncharacterized protein n=1 Tax=Venturia effusa TaxID=50376 RepID=A0A517LNE3_9PEZI|nr:hypothetical protein FKW77_001752 [Venturia effusa]
MNLSSVLAFLTTIATVSANAYKLCCCHNKANCSNNVTESVVAALVFVKDWKMSTKTWSTTQDAPFNCTGCYAYAPGEPNDDGYIGIKEMRGYCKDYEGLIDSQYFNVEDDWLSLATVFVWTRESRVFSELYHSSTKRPSTPKSALSSRNPHTMSNVLSELNPSFQYLDGNLRKPDLLVGPSTRFALASLRRNHAAQQFAVRSRSHG